jgi:hypothetical protein
MIAEIRTQYFQKKVQSESAARSVVTVAERGVELSLRTAGRRQLLLSVVLLYVKTYGVRMTMNPERGRI